MDKRRRSHPIDFGSKGILVMVHRYPCPFFLVRLLNTKIPLRSHDPKGIGFSFGGDKEDRTPDLLHAMQALSQLSYAPKRLL